LSKAADFLRSGIASAGGVRVSRLEEVECFLMKKAITRYDGNVSQAAKALGLSRSALYRRLQRYGF
jgi:transcriptional regulator of acetoin/glycerol metabolism